MSGYSHMRSVILCFWSSVRSGPIQILSRISCTHAGSAGSLACWLAQFARLCALSMWAIGSIRGVVPSGAGQPCNPHTCDCEFCVDPACLLLNALYSCSLCFSLSSVSLFASAPASLRFCPRYCLACCTALAASLSAVCLPCVWAATPLLFPSAWSHGLSPL